MRKLGIDIGGTTIKGGVVENGKVIKYYRTETGASSGTEKVFENLYGVIDELIDMTDENSPIGISSAGDIDPVKGKVIYATNAIPGYTGADIKSNVECHTGRKTYVKNDCIAALSGEMAYGAAKGYKNAVMLTLGTGLGGAAAVDGRILSGEHFRATRLGHVVLYKDGRLCACGKRGCSEAYVSATGLIATASENGIEIDDCSQLARYRGTPEFDRTVEQFTGDLNTVLDNLAAVFDPAVIVIGGGLIMLKDLWWDRLLSVSSLPCKITGALLKNDSGIIGATVI